MKPIHNLKDNAYKLIFGTPEMFLEFLHNFINIDILKNLKPSDIEDISDRFLPMFDDNRDSDTVKKIRLSETEPLFVIGIIEHESEVNYTSSFKMLQYITYILSDFIKLNDEEYHKQRKAGNTKLKLSTSKDFKLPPVLPIVFYDGKTKWTSSLSLAGRTQYSEIFSKYIPEFEYELVDLNKYSLNDLVNYGNLLSFFLIVDKVRKAEDIELLSSLPESYFDNLNMNVPESLLKLLSDCMKLFLKKADVEEEKIEEITGKVYRRRFADMFDVEFSFREVKQKLREEVKKEVKEEVKQEVKEEVKKEVKKEVEEEVREKFEKKAKESAIETVRNLLKNGVSIKIISLSTGLDESAVGEIKSKLALV
ncbi:MAG: Rpn family recombination-promoting nuclease/putative transposase [Clostridiales bacterium]|jgi:hypothetical protein|nr:Rpn family recombination-promoting nuclease/putative transposase [Clostridiales bacterium]